MPSPEQDALDAARREDGTLDHDRYLAEYRHGLETRQERLRQDARAIFRAMDGWSAVQTQEDWEAVVRQAEEDLDRGGFLIERLGAERYVDPQLTAMLLVLRRRLIEEHGATTAADLLMIDCALLSYYHLQRINGWIGNLAQWLETEFFRNDSLTATFKGQYGASRVRGLTVEDIVARLAEQLLPLLDRSNRLVLRNLAALREQRRGPAPSVQIGQAGQVNVAAMQTNAANAATGNESTLPGRASGAEAEV